MKQSKDRIKDGLMLIMVMVGVMIAGMTLTACSDEEEIENNNSVICYEINFQYFRGVITYDSIVSSKIFYVNDTTSSVNREYRVLIPDSVPNMELGEACLTWIENNSTTFIAGGKTYTRVIYIGYDQKYPISRSSIESGDCGITTETSNFAPINWSTLIRSRNAGEDENNYCPINVYYHGIEFTGSAAISSPNTNAESIISELNKYYSGSGIYFILKGVTTHKVSEREWESSLTNSEFCNKLYGLDGHGNGIDIYELNDINITDATVAGTSKDIGETSLIVRLKNRNSTTVSHEMGHCLGLYHTHHGTDPNESGVPEYADGSNGLIAGDYIPDTPADPNKWIGGVEYNSALGLVDGKRQSYNPDPTLLMSYCHNVRNRFSPMQITAMQYHINNDGILKSTLAEYAVTGPASKHFKSSTTLTLKQNDNLESVIWTIVHKSAPAGAEEGALVETTETLYGTNITISSSKSEIIEATPRVMRMQHGRTLPTVMITSGAPSPFTGQLLWESTGGEHGVTTNMSHGEPMSVSGDVTFDLSYLDMAGATLSGLDYRVVTAANRVLSGKTMTVNKADCSQGFLKVRTYDDCGASDGYFTIPVTVYGAYYGVNVADGSVTFDSRMGATPAGGKQMAPAAKRSIGSVVVYDASGNEVKRMEASDGRMSAEVNTAGWPKGEYKAVVSDGNGYTQEIPFAI